MMRKRQTSATSMLRRVAAVVFRLCLLAAIWHAPLPAMSLHADTNHAGSDDGDEHNHASSNDASSQHLACEFRFVLPCQLGGCEHSSLPHDDSDHSRHLASFAYGALSKPAADLGCAATNCGPDLRPMTLMAAVCHPSLLLTVVPNCGAPAHLADAEDAPTLPLRANLQVFLI